ncbi:MAG TPA: D-alanyl-D-alanine carboxypeptidase family protein [Bacillota bacterium]|jgi:D-alanyl-D-alanine carboxypeptidase (penicillin-binding protein 5/6)|nr:D-alanyl-D-alanine carboxypeptidase [Bacillota bacterium]HOB89392.1 D-alanyl-D-alanine carboxypeptidase family protein [Bacillota bacterium]HQE03691.1 D-alanyl-D-alanine carboxypeptidase family protein [Bacillota bacterium]
MYISRTNRIQQYLSGRIFKSRFWSGAVCLCVIAALMVSMAPLSQAAAPSLKTKSAILIDAETGQVLYEKNADMRLAPASMTKIMTMLLAMEAVEAGKASLDDMVVASTAASQIGGSQIWLMEGEEMRFEDMMRAVAIVSANDAAFALAEYIAGTEPDFVRLMNERAKELGLANTQFQNSDGLPAEGHYSSARDVAIMSRELVTKHPKVLEWTSVWTDWLQRLHPRASQKESFLRNTNELIVKYPGADGLKTGMTSEAGFCLSATAKRNDTRLISVVMALPSNAERLDDTIKLLDYGFREFDRVVLATEGQNIGSVRIPNGHRELVAASVDRDYTVLVPRDKRELITTEFVSDERKAPIPKGGRLGEVIVSVDGEEIIRVNVVSTEDVPKANFFTLLSRGIRDFFRGLFKRPVPQTEISL